MEENFKALRSEVERRNEELEHRLDMVTDEAQYLKWTLTARQYVVAFEGAFPSRYAQDFPDDLPTPDFRTFCHSVYGPEPLGTTEEVAKAGALRKQRMDWAHGLGLSPVDLRRVLHLKRQGNTTAHPLGSTHDLFATTLQEIQEFFLNNPLYPKEDQAFSAFAALFIRWFQSPTIPSMVQITC